MGEILFVNGCMREKGRSRTLLLAESFLDAYRAKNAKDHVFCVNLAKEGFLGHTPRSLTARDRLLGEKNFSHPVFSHARRFAAADKIVVAAPYWDFSFPAVLKAYLEHVCVPGITFGYTETGSAGLCRAEKLLYVTTRGGVLQSPGQDLGQSYLDALCGLFGIGDFDVLAAQGLDEAPGACDEILQNARKEAQSLAQIW